MFFAVGLGRLGKEVLEMVDEEEIVYNTINLEAKTYYQEGLSIEYKEALLADSEDIENRIVEEIKKEVYKLKQIEHFYYRINYHTLFLIKGSDIVSIFLSFSYQSIEYLSNIGGAIAFCNMLKKAIEKVIYRDTNELPNKLEANYTEKINNSYQIEEDDPDKKQRQLQLLTEYIKSAEIGSNKYTTWALSIIGGSLLAFMHKDFHQPELLPDKLFYVLFILEWLLLFASIYYSSKIGRASISKNLNMFNIDALRNIGINTNKLFRNQIKFFYYGLSVFAIWLSFYFLWRLTKGLFKIIFM
ncbi:MAG: hypothetical protein WBB45_11690 [Cyclobacteriaceae bacterium]